LAKGFRCRTALALRGFGVALGSDEERIQAAGRVPCCVKSQKGGLSGMS
jgi:hypothetical protein